MACVEEQNKLIALCIKCELSFHPIVKFQREERKQTSVGLINALMANSIHRQSSRSCHRTHHVDDFNLMKSAVKGRWGAVDFYSGN